MDADVMTALNQNSVSFSGSLTRSTLPFAAIQNAFSVTIRSQQLWHPLNHSGNRCDHFLHARYLEELRKSFDLAFDLALQNPDFLSWDGLASQAH
jgi:hypothetical protein